MVTTCLNEFNLDFKMIKTYCFFMQSHRLARLLRMIVEVRTQPQKPPEQIAKELGVSIRQFYYDRNQLAEMGFALNGLFTIVKHMPDPQKQLLQSLVQDVIIKDGFGCSPKILDDVMQAVDEKRRILVHSRQSPKGKPLSLDPFELCFIKTKLYVDAYAVERKKRIRYRMANIDRVIFTPFYRPKKAY